MSLFSEPTVQNWLFPPSNASWRHVSGDAFHIAALGGQKMYMYLLKKSAIRNNRINLLADFPRGDGHAAAAGGDCPN